MNEPFPAAAVNDGIGKLAADMVRWYGAGAVAKVREWAARSDLRYSLVVARIEQMQAEEQGSREPVATAAT